MKRVLLPILVFLFTAVSSNGQNWNPLSPGVKRYYTNNLNYLKGMRVDSVVASGSDLKYYTFKTWRGVSEGGLGLFADTMTVFPGFETVRKQDGSFLFFNYWGDTLRIKTLAAVGDSWWFHQDDSGLSYRAEITSADFVSILGVNDSIKRILLTAYVNGVPAPGDTFNNTEIIISKGHGFHTMVDMTLFPYRAPGDTAIVNDYYLYAALWPQNHYNLTMTPAATLQENCLFRLIDYPTLSAAELNDWNVGDVFEYRGCYVAFGTTEGCGQYWFYRLDTIVSKTIVGDSVWYGRKGWSAHLNQFNYYDLAPYSDTVYHSMIPYQDYMMPEEYVSLFNSCSAPRHYFPADTSYCYTGDAFYTYGWTLGLPGSFWRCLNKKGVGLVQELGGQVHESINERSLIYFVRNGVPCGTFVLPDTSLPVSVVNVNKPEVKVYPNPANEVLNVEATIPAYNLSLTNAVGQVVYMKQSCGSKEQLNTNSFAEGVYYIRLEFNKQEVITHKVIIQN